MPKWIIYAYSIPALALVAGAVLAIIGKRGGNSAMRDVGVSLLYLAIAAEILATLVVGFVNPA